MSALQIFGIVMMFVPLFVLFLDMAKQDGWKTAVGVFAITFFVVAWISLGAFLAARP